MSEPAIPRDASPSKTSSASLGLLAVLGVVFGISVTVGNTIGSGILRTPGVVAEKLPTPFLFLAVWVFGGFYAALGANSLAELAAMMPESGGYTVYLRRAMGPYAGFVIGWSDWLSTCSSLALAALVIGEYLTILFGIAGNLTSTFASAVIVVFALIQLRGVKTGSLTQNVTAVVKALAFAVLIVACFVLGHGFDQGGRTAPLTTGFPLLVAFVLAMQAVIFTYDGWNGIVYFAGELRNPDRDIPRSMFGGVAAVAVIYLLVNLGFLYVLTIDQMAGQPLVAATAANAIFGGKGDAVIRVLTIVSLLSAVNAYQLMTSRVLHRLGVFGFVPAADYVNVGGTPVVAVLLSAAACLAMVITGTLEIVLAVTAFLFVAQYALIFLTVFVLRGREPEARRPFRAIGHPWTTGFVLALSIAFLAGAFFADTRNSIYSLILLAVSWPIYLMIRPRTNET
ncbi:MAG TPA: APC family permease [Gemmatimonadaceae bacterium]|nr:APC family permease [Gemmatimonadaceae bacterium]